MFAFSNVLHLFTDELSRLCGRRLSFARVTPRTLECLSFRHSEPPNQRLHKSVPFGHHSEPAGGPLLEMTGSARKIPVVHYRAVNTASVWPSLVPGKNGSRNSRQLNRDWELRLDFRSLPWSVKRYRDDGTSVASSRSMPCAEEAVVGGTRQWRCCRSARVC